MEASDDLTALTARAALYGVLARAFRVAPDAEAVGALEADWFRAAVAVCLPTFPTDAAPDAETVEVIRADHMALLRVPLGRYLPPFEAVHRDPREVEGEPVGGLLMGPSTIAVKKSYAAAGVDLSGAVEELPDHIGLELAFMADLLDREVVALDGGHVDEARVLRRHQAAFVTDHLAEWAPSYCERLGAAAETEWYRRVARLTAALCLADRDRLREAL